MTFPLLGATTPSYRSLLFFDPEEQQGGRPIAYYAGTEGIEAYLDVLGEGRLVQSFKTHLTTEKLSGGDELMSIASGLALQGYRSAG